MKTKIYIAGCGGMLGEAFYKQYKDDFILRCTDKDVNESWLSFLDFRDYDAYKKDVINFNPDYIFHLGAHTDLEYCKTHIDDTYNTNTLAVENAVHIANQLDIPILYISSAGIFDGMKNFYDDWDIPNPIDHYARAKYAGERYIVENARRYLVCRPGWMMGAGPRKDKKFVQKIMLQLKQGKKELFVVNDKFGTPTYTHDFAKNVKLLLQKEFWGVYNIVCGGETSRLEVARELLEILDLKGKVQIHSVSSEYFAKEYFAERPICERLINQKLNIRKINIMRDWRIALREYLTDYYEGYLNI